MSSRSVAIVILLKLFTVAPALAQPACLISFGTTLARVNGTGGSELEVFSSVAPSSVIGLTVVPEGVSLAQCSAGDVVAVEEGANPTLWRVDNARAGTPQLVPIGQLSVNVSSIAFAHGQMFAIGSGGVFHEINLSTLGTVGTSVDLSTVTNNIGGLTFDGVGTWYTLNGSNRLFRADDPPTAASYTQVGNGIGVNVGACGLEMYAGQLFAGMSVGTDIVIGTCDLITGNFGEVWRFPDSPGGNCGFVTFDSRCPADLDDDGDVANGLTRDNAVDINDLLAFLVGFEAGDVRIDLDDDGDPTTGTPDEAVDINDLLFFLARFEAGC